MIDALANTERLDSEFVTTLLTEHSSGLSVLPALDGFASTVAFDESGLQKLLYIMQDQFAYLVVDAGSATATRTWPLTELGDAVYLVTQLDVPSLRNAHRMISHLQSSMPDGRRLEVVANRYDGRNLEISQEKIEKTLGAPLKWKIPNDYGSVSRAQNTGSPLALDNSSIQKVLLQMAKAACGKPLDDPKRRFSLFG